MADIETIQQNTINNAAYTTDSIHLSDLSPDQQELIQQTKEIAIDAINQTETLSANDTITKSVEVVEGSPELTQIAINAGIIQEKNPLETMREIKEYLQDEIIIAKLNDDKPQVSYLCQMSQLIAEISTLLNQWTARDNARSETKKKEYTESSTAIEDNHYTKADWNLVLGGIGAVIGLYPPTQGLAGPFSNLVQGFNSHLDAGVTQPNQKMQLTIQELSKMDNASSSNNDLREKALQILEAIKQWAITAARHG